MEHKFLDLKIGDIEQYTMIVKKSELDVWKKEGWKTYSEIGLPEGEEDADLLYGEFDKETETLIFNEPVTLNMAAENKIIGRKIIGYSVNLGTYGMGGAGFFGLLLDNSEYLTYAVWRAGNYVILEDKVVECNPELYSKVTPLISNFGEEKTWDDLTILINESKIISYTFSEDHFKLIAEKESNIMQIEFVKNDKRLPRKVGRKRNAYKKGKIADFILFQHKEGVLIV